MGFKVIPLISSPLPPPRFPPWPRDLGIWSAYVCRGGVSFFPGNIFFGQFFFPGRVASNREISTK